MYIDYLYSLDFFLLIFFVIYMLVRSEKGLAIISHHPHKEFKFFLSLMTPLSLFFIFVMTLATMTNFKQLTFQASACEFIYLIKPTTTNFKFLYPNRLIKNIFF